MIPEDDAYKWLTGVDIGWLFQSASRLQACGCREQAKWLKKEQWQWSRAGACASIKFA